MRAMIKTHHIANETMQGFVLLACDELDKLGGNKVLPAVFSLEDFLYGAGKEKPLEIKAAMEWGALWAAKESGQIDWNTMREMFGEFVSKQIGLR